jgi:predicted regulator of Ras-like GTPase activity (Roadblock/LC7/MglB family)
MSDPLAAALDRLSRVPGVRGALVVDVAAGVPVVAEVEADVDPAALAALAASVFRQTDRATEAAEFGRLRTVQLEARAGHVIVAGAGDLALVVVAAEDAQLGLIRLEAHRTVEAFP